MYRKTSVYFEQFNQITVAWNRSLCFFMLTVGVSCLATVLYRSLFSKSLSAATLTQRAGKSTKMSKPPPTISASGQHTASVIFLHGLGDVGDSWLEAFDMYGIPSAVPHVKFIFPTAPIRKVTLNNGMAMNSWFDAYGLDRSAREDQEGILQASQSVHDLVDKEIKAGIAPQRLIIGGFSMGGAVALHAGLTSPHTLGGVLALSTWLPLATTFPKALIAGDKKVNLPILQCHGSEDPMVRLQWGQMSEKLFKTMGFKNYDFKVYKGMAHSSSDQEMKDVTTFIKQHLPKQQAKL